MTIVEMAAPSELRVSKERDQLTVSFTDGVSRQLSAEFLRVVSPSAEVQGHSPEQRVTVGGKINVQIMKLESVGNYAVRITFDDMHDSGIYSWAYFRELCETHEEKWAEYLKELDEKKMSRER